MRTYLQGAVLLTLLVLLVPGESSAQWNQLLLTDTMNYESVYTVNRNWVWFTGYSGENSTVQVTSDGGQTWAGGILGGYQIKDLAESNYAYVLLVGRSVDCDCGVVVRSTDGGSTWGSSTTEGIDRLTTIAFSTPTTVFAGGHDGVIFGSTDAGATWAFAMQEGDDVIMELEFPSSRTGFGLAGVDGEEVDGSRLYGTTDGGESWEVLFDAESGVGVFHDVSFGTDRRGLLAGYRNGPALWRTDDGGHTWTEVHHIDDPALRFRTVTFAGADSAYAAGDDGIIYASYDGGLTWEVDRTLLDVAVWDISFRDGVGWTAGPAGVRMKTVKAVGPDGYCLPPVTGPVYGSGITFVGLDSSPKIRRTSRGDELYSWHADPEALPTLRRGDQYMVEVSTDPNNVDAHNSSRVWIDFNRDGDFEDEWEDVGIWDIHDLATIQSVLFTVPLGAVEGETIMRVYTDMPSTFGHDEPRPCGYLTSENVIGHHGEVEDYTVRIVNENAASVADGTPGTLSIVSHAGQIELRGLNRESEVSLVDIEGREVSSWIAPAGASAYSPGSLTPGTYFVRVMGGASERSLVYRIEFGR